MTARFKSHIKALPLVDGKQMPAAREGEHRGSTGASGGKEFLASLAYLSPLLLGGDTLPRRNEHV